MQHPHRWRGAGPDGSSFERGALTPARSAALPRQWVELAFEGSLFSPARAGATPHVYSVIHLFFSLPFHLLDPWIYSFIQQAFIRHLVCA